MARQLISLSHTGIYKFYGYVHAFCTCCHPAAALCAVQGRQVLLGGTQVQPGFACLAVLLVKLRLFGNQFLALGFQLFQAWLFLDVVGLEIGGCRLIGCQLGLNANYVFDDEGILSKVKGTLAQTD